MKTEDAIKQLQEVMSGANGRNWGYGSAVESLMFAYFAQRDQNRELKAKLELLNGTAASKLEKHNAEMEEYKKQVIALREEGKSWAMIAELTGINVSTVRSWVRNAK